MISGLTAAAAALAGSLMALSAPMSGPSSPPLDALRGSQPLPVLDRYGAALPTPVLKAAPTAPPSGRRLIWPGKALILPSGLPTRPNPVAAGPPSGSSLLSAARQATLRPAQASSQRPTLPLAAGAPSAAPAPERRADGPRFYSLHRDYGLAPDAIPLPPKFFGPTADLSRPPESPLVRRLGNRLESASAAGEDGAAALDAPSP